MSFWDLFKKREDNKQSTVSSINVDATTIFWTKFQRQLPDLIKLDALEAIEEANQLLHQFFPELCIEFELNNDNKTYSKIVLSADGKVDHFNEVIKLVKSAPVISGTEIIAFRQMAEKVSLNFGIEMHGISLDCGDILVFAEPFRGRLDLNIAFNKAIAEEQLQHTKHITYIMLDHILGEYDFAIKVDAVNFVETKENDQFVPLPQFIPVFNKLWVEELGHNQTFPEEANEQWLTFELKDNENDTVTAVGQLNKSAQSLACRADVGMRLDIVVDVPEKSVIDRIYLFEDALSAQLRPLQKGILVLTMLVFAEQTRTMTWYVTDKLEALELAQQLAKKYPELSMKIDISYDPIWSSYLYWL